METEVQTPAEMPTHLTGYQWGDSGRYIGSYTFENNMDQEKVHLPPRTTLVAPPTGLPVDEEAAWDEARGRWVVQRVEMAYLPDREVPHGN